MQSTLKIKDPSKYFPWTRCSSATQSYFFFVSLILRWESTASIQGGEFGDSLLPPTANSPIFHFSMVNRILLNFSLYFYEKWHSHWKQHVTCSKCITSHSPAFHFNHGKFLCACVIHVLVIMTKRVSKLVLKLPDVNQTKIKLDNCYSTYIQYTIYASILPVNCLKLHLYHKGKLLIEITFYSKVSIVVLQLCSSGALHT